MKVEERLTLCIFKTDKISHIKINHEICRKACTKRSCLHVCPGNLYSYNTELDEIVVEFTGCLECGTCRVACIEGAIEWQYPGGGYGVQYRYG
jgi:ferredoxin like protein